MDDNVQNGYQGIKAHFEFKSSFTMPEGRTAQDGIEVRHVEAASFLHVDRMHYSYLHGKSMRRKYLVLAFLVWGRWARKLLSFRKRRAAYAAVAARRDRAIP
jgi:hypothetical protein